MAIDIEFHGKTSGTITVYVNPNLDIVTSGRTPSLDEAKAQFLRNWQKCQQRPNGDR
jgi:hypothetical protein